VGRPARAERGPGARSLTDILAGHGTDPDLLAELYDLEHEEVRHDLHFYREWTRRSTGTVIDLGCGSGRLFGAFLAGGARRVIGVDGSPALLRRARSRIAADPRLDVAAAAGRLQLKRADVRHVERRDRSGLLVMAGVLAHLDGPEDALQALTCAGRLLATDGFLIIDGVGPGGLPRRDLPLSVDWRKTLRGRPVVRRSQLMRRETPEGLRVVFSSLVDWAKADGTIARLPASFRLWYPSPSALLQLVQEAGLVVETTFGSHDLEPLGPESERCIVIARSVAMGRSAGARGE
jgi:SAM-dependent methyltransferase